MSVLKYKASNGKWLPVGTANIVQSTDDGENVAMLQKAVTDLTNTLAMVFIANNGKLYVERTSGYTYIKCTANIVIGNSKLGKTGYPWSDVIADIGPAYVTTSPTGVTDCVKVGDGGDCFVFNVSTQQFDLKLLQTVNTAEEIVLFLNNYYEFGGCLYSKAEEVANTLATVFLDPNADFYSEYSSDTQYIKIEGSNPRILIRNLHLGSLTYKWSEIIDDPSVSAYVITSPSGKEQTIKITSGSALVFNVVTQMFVIMPLTNVDSTIHTVLFYQYYTTVGGALSALYEDRLNKKTRSMVESFSEYLKTDGTVATEKVDLDYQQTYLKLTVNNLLDGHYASFQPFDMVCVSSDGYPLASICTIFIEQYDEVRTLVYDSKYSAFQVYPQYYSRENGNVYLYFNTSGEYLQVFIRGLVEKCTGATLEIVDELPDGWENIEIEKHVTTAELGDVEAALDRIIQIQESYIGG